MPFYCATPSPHSVTDLTRWKSKEMLVILRSINSVYKMQTFNNANLQTLKYSNWIGNKKQINLILQKL